MKVKFKKNYIDVEQQDIVRQRIFMFVYMLLILIGVYLVCSKTIEKSLSSVTQVERENKSSSEFEIELKDFESAQFLDNNEITEICNSKILISQLNSEFDFTSLDLTLTTLQSDSVLDYINTYEEIEEDYIDGDENMNEENTKTYEIEEITDDIVEETIEEEEEIVEELVIEETEPEKELYLDLNEHEKSILCQIVEAEVTGTGASFGTSDDVVRTSKFRVARVVINRVLDPRFPDTVEGVVFQKRQFSPILDGRYWKVTVNDLTREAVDMALDKSVPDDIQGALYFTSGKGFSSRKLSYIMTDEVGHKFYR